MEEGGLAPMMVGYEYVLVESALAEYIEILELPRLEVIAAVIYDPRQNQEIRTYRQLRISHHFSSDMLREINLDGEKFLIMSGTYLFVSPLLKQRLDASPFKYLRFTEGLSEFAGKET
jgi:hypothetical protein